LSIELVVQGAADKLVALVNVLAQANVPPEAVCYIGDDLPDVSPLLQCGLAVAVDDACPDVRAVAHYVTRNRGGRGAVREAIELILRCQERWPGSNQR
jgi:3-deoxy-D-manno-octulosonate 8-phosphate phosphatase (KDO 8-P phosphatase)